MRRRVGALLAATALVSGGLAVGGGTPVAAATALFVDAAAGSPGADCSAADPCATVNAALTRAAEVFAEGETEVDVVVAAGTYTENLWITIGTGLELRITGAGPDTTIIESAGSAQPVLALDGDGALVVHGVTLTGGEWEFGGGVVNQATLTLRQAEVSGNRATALGGGIYNEGTLTIEDASIVGNTAVGGGGGILNEGTLTITGSTIADNTATAAESIGGGLGNVGSATIHRAAFLGNTSGTAGGGVWNEATLSVENTTFTQNTAGMHGGGVATRSDAPSELVAVTSIGNAAGDLTTAGTGPVAVRGSIVGVSACEAAVAASWNVFVSTTGCWAADASNAVATTDALGLAAPAPDAGAPATMAITWESAAHAHVPVAECLTTDQRGLPRPGTAGAPACDAGAYEWQAAGQGLQQVAPFSGEVVSGNAFTDQLSVLESLGPVTYRTTSDPGPVAVSTAGVVSAGPDTPAGVYALSGTMTDTAGNSGSWTYTLTVIGTEPVITSPDTVTLIVDRERTFAITTTGSPIPTITVTGSVPGMTFTDRGDGVGLLSGTPTEVGTFELTVRASNGDPATDAVQMLTVTVDEAPPPTPASSWAAVTVGEDVACALTGAGRALCWGSDADGAVGDGVPAEDRLFPVPVEAPDGVVWTSIDAGAHHVCATTSDGDAYCWGSDNHGRLGNGDALDGVQYAPSRVAAPADVDFVQIAAGATHSCAVTSTGDIYCWGDNDNGGLGNAESGGYRTAPVQVVDPAGETPVWDAVSVGARATCGHTTDSTVFCWGDDPWKGLGAGWDTPQPVAAPTGGAWDQVARGTVACGLLTSGAPYCWGVETGGEVGNGGAFDDLIQFPTAVDGGHTFAMVDTFGGHSCGVTGQGAAWCWGRNGSGQLGYPTDFTAGARQVVPVPVTTPPGEAWVTLSTGYATTCGIAASGDLYCWGRGPWGNGDTGETADPQRVGPAAQTIDLAPIDDVTFGVAPFEVTATATSGLDVTLTATGACTLDGTTLTVTGVGTCTVSAEQAGDRLWAAAPSVSTSFAIGPAAATVHITDTQATYDGAAHPVTVTTEPAGLPVEVRYDGSPSAPSAPGEYHVTVLVTDPNYVTETTPVAGTLVIERAAVDLTLTGPAAATPVGDPATFTVTLTGPATDTPPSGSVTFTVTGGPSGTVDVVDGVATWTTPGLPYGDAEVTAAYPGDAFHLGAVATPVTHTVTTHDLTITGLPEEVTVGDEVTVTATGFEPGETVDAELHSTPQVVATGDADDVGTVVLTFVVPDVEAGPHTLVLTGRVSARGLGQTVVVAAVPTPTSPAPTTTPPGPTTTLPVNPPTTVLPLPTTTVAGPPTVPPGGLPATGGAIVPIVVVAALLVVGGTALVRVRRRGAT